MRYAFPSSPLASPCMRVSLMRVPATEPFTSEGVRVLAETPLCLPWSILRLKWLPGYHDRVELYLKLGKSVKPVLQTLEKAFQDISNINCW